LEFSVITGFGRPSRRPRSSGAGPASAPPGIPRPVLPARQITPPLGPVSGVKIFPFCSRANQFIPVPSHPVRGAARDRHERAVGCDGRRWRARRTRRKRTAKSCGSGAAVLALSPRGAKLLEGDGGKRAVLRGEHEVSRKPLRREGRSVPAALYARVQFCLAQIARETAGAASTRSSLRPLSFERVKSKQTSGDQRREKAKLYQRHCERKRSNPLSRHAPRWIASLRSQ
jgi:hypothetical protein